MDIFAGVDIEALRKQLDSDPSLKKGKKEAAKAKKLSPSALEAKWNDADGLNISIPDSLIEDMGWIRNTKLDMIMHDNVIILYPVKGFLNLRKISGKSGKSILISKDHFNDHKKMKSLTGECKVWEDNVTAYHRLVVQFSEAIPKAFSH